MPKKSWKSIVVAIGNPSAKEHIAIRKAQEISRGGRATITLLHVFGFPYPLSDGDNLSAPKILERTAASFRKRLTELAEPLKRAGVKVKCAVAWDFPIHEGIVRHVLRTKPDLLIAESHHHGTVARWFLSNTDWELIRACPCPLWFVKKPGFAKKPLVLAALDPFHANAKPAGLDDRIAVAARDVAHDIGGRVLLTHVCDLMPDVIGAGSFDAVAIPPQPERVEASRSAAGKALAKLAKRFAIDPEDRLVVVGAPAVELGNLAKRRAVDVMVMGAVSRRGLQRFFIGSTAERVIDPIRCDVLILKPKGFKTSVPRRGPALKS